MNESREWGCMGLAAAAVVERREARAAEQAAKRARVEASVARLQVVAGLATVQKRKQQKRKAAVAQSASPDAGLAADSFVSAARTHAKTLSDKKATRRSCVINALLPKGAGKLSAFPRREEDRFGEEGAQGDALFEKEMAAFSAAEFGSQHCQWRVIRQKFGQVRTAVL